jgi:hypothetical protein
MLNHRILIVDVEMVSVGPLCILYRGGKYSILVESTILYREV